MGSEVRHPAWVVGERAARALRFQEGLGHAPIDVYDVIARRGVALAIRDLDGDDGRYIFHDGRALIIVRSDCEESSRQRFTAAHELGHHELHRYGGDGEVPTYLVDRTIYATGGERHEVEANAFAGCLLLPTEALQAEFSERGKVEVEQVVEIMRRYRVSYRTAVYRLHNSERITAPRRDALLRDGEGQIRDLRGEVEDPRQPTPPAELERSLVKLYRARLVGAERLAESLGLSAAQVLERFGEPEPVETGADTLLAELEDAEE